MATRRSLRNMQTPQKDANRSTSESDQESDNENNSLPSQASGSVSYCSESPGSASFEIRNRSTLSSPGSGTSHSGKESPFQTPKSKITSHSSPLAYQRDAGLYPDLSGVSPATRSPRSPRSPKSPRKQKQQEPECKEYHVDQNFIIIVAIIVGLLVAGVWMYTRSAGDSSKQHVGTQTPNPRQVVRDAFSLGSRKLNAAFPSQTSHFWATINAAVKSIMDPNMEALQPAVVMVTCVKETCHLANCIASHLAKSVTEAYASEPFLDVNVTSDLLALRAEDAKLRIDDDIRSSLQYGSRAVVLRNLHDLQGGAAMILHGFCDNENAPFKEAVLIFTLELASNTIINTAIGLNNAIEATLDKSWGKALDTDNLSALYSRLVNSPVYVKSESVEVFQKQCNQI